MAIWLELSVTETGSFVLSKKVHTENHLGLEVSSQAELDKVYKQLQENGLVSTSEKEREHSTCCYAKQDKFWVKDPSGYEWEIYFLTEDSENKGKAKEKTQCCA